MKILSVFGTRPEAIKMAPVVGALERQPGIQSIVCLTAQHRSMLDQVIDLFAIKADFDLNLMADNQGLTHITSAVLKGLEPILRETYGIMVYQEQVMQIAQVLSGYSLGEADLLRRAMGKKIKFEMDAQKERFISGAVAKGIEASRADFIFELVAKFAGYGFNKSHAAAYAVVAYQTAYLKANYPVEFLAASMTLDIGNTDKLMQFRQEAQRMGVRIAPPSVNESGVDFSVREGTILYALAALRNVGAGAMQSLVAAREAGGRAEKAELLGAELFVEVDGIGIPVERHPFEAAALAFVRDPGDRDEQRTPAAAMAEFGPHVNIFEIEPAPPEKSRQIVKENRVADGLVAVAGDQRFGHQHPQRR